MNRAPNSYSVAYRTKNRRTAHVAEIEIRCDSGDLTIHLESGSLKELTAAVKERLKAHSNIPATKLAGQEWLALTRATA